MNQEKIDKPIHFISLITLDEGMLSNLNDNIQRSLPIDNRSHWIKPVIESCNIVNIDSWRRNFSKWTINRVSEY